MSNTQLSAGERLDCYLHIREFITNNLEDDEIVVCDFLDDFYSSLRPEANELFAFYRMNLCFPEFYHQKPPHLHKCDPWWSRDVNGNQHRVFALNRAIKELIESALIK